MRPTRKLAKLREELYAHEKKCPVVASHACMVVTATSVMPTDNITKDDLIKLISMDGDISFFTGRWNAVFIKRTYQHTETEEERDARVTKEKEAYAKWEEERDTLLKQIEELEQEIAATRPTHPHFQDQEYIEFLRLRAKMIEKGYPVI